MEIISTLLDFRMGKHYIKKLVSEAEKAASQNKYADALSKIDEAIRKTDDIDEQKQLVTYRSNLIEKEFSFKSSETKKRILKALSQKDYQFAEVQYQDAHEDKSLAEDDDYEVYKEIEYSKNLSKAQSFYEDGSLDLAYELVNKAINYYQPPREDATLLLKSICKKKEAIDKENNRKGLQFIRNFPSFNIPKKENEGEDADPLVIADEDTNWGVIGVFDGMGGAGARKYKSISKDEEHTSAYWGSRIVRQSILDLIECRPFGENPIMYIESKLHECIKSELDKCIQDFPNANGSVLNKMVRKLPTTMALCSFEIEDKSKVTINSYWAGDSRIYLLTKDRLEFLTIDDANAEDDDPFSPINMDLAMNNAISQEREFRINKVSKQYVFSETNPILLIAATDGCFGYFKNPIEFEYMLRQCLIKSDDEKDFMDKIKQAIIDNIQQDDFSMAIEAFGYTDFETLKRSFSNDVESTLVNDYLEWRSKKDQDYEDHKKKTAELEQQLISSKEYLENFYEEMEKENMNWYNKYKETFLVVDRSEITNV